MSTNTAIFYDIENLVGPFTGKTNTILQLDEIYRRVLAAPGVQGVSIQRAYADWVLPLHRNLRGSVLQVGIEPVQIFNTNPYDKIKNAADVALIIDAVELIAKRPEIDTYVIATGDGIFAFLAKKLHEHGKRVIGIGFERIVNQIFRNSCDLYIGLEKTDKSIVSAVAGRKKAEPQAAQAAAPAADAPAPPAPVRAARKPAAPPAPPKIPAKFPKTKYSEVMVHAEIPVWRDLANVPGTLMVVRRLLEVLHSDATKDLPDLEISVFMTYLKHYVPGFTAKRFAFSHFRDFMRFMTTKSPLLVYAEENSLKLGRRSSKEKKGEIFTDIAGLQFNLADGTRKSSIFDVPEGVSFTYSVVQEAAKAPAKAAAKPAAPKPRAAKAAVKAPAKAASVPKPRAAKTPSKPKRVTEKPPEPSVIIDEGSVRKWIKTQFAELSKADKLSSAEARRMTTDVYAQKTFGIRTPIFREIKTHANLEEQRKVGNKVKYWKETFKFNGRFYLIYKEWVVTLHADRFAAWLKKVQA